MSRRPRHTRPDANQAQIIEGLRAGGFTVYDISTLPDSQCPGDILVYGYHGEMRRHVWQPFEIKTATGQPTKLQAANAQSGAVPIARSAIDIMEWYGRIQ